MAIQPLLIPDHIPNTLVEYGIQTEESDYRVHIGFAAAMAYAFPTEAGCEAVKWCELIGKPPNYAKDPCVTDHRGPTARGYRISPDQIYALQAIRIPPAILALDRCRCSLHDTTSKKGQAAVAVARAMIGRGLIRFPAITTEIRDYDLQLVGQDILVTSEIRIQIKCDFMAGFVYRNGTVGGLYLQTHERNPLKQY